MTYTLRNVSGSRQSIPSLDVTVDPGETFEITGDAEDAVTITALSLVESGIYEEDDDDFLAGVLAAIALADAEEDDDDEEPEPVPPIQPPLVGPDSATVNNDDDESTDPDTED